MCLEKKLLPSTQNQRNIKIEGNMENKKFKKLALMGLAGGLLCAGEASAAGHSTYGTQASSGCGGVAVGNNCGAANAPAGQTVSVGCAAKQIGFPNNQDGNIAVQEANYQDKYSDPRQEATQQQYYNGQPAAQPLQQGQVPQQGQSISQGCSSKSDPQAGQTRISQSCASSGQPSSHGCASAPRQHLTQGCGSHPKSSQNNNNNYYYADALKDDQNQADKYQDSNSKQLAENEVRPGAKLADPRLTEKDFQNQLSSQSKATFQSLPPEGKALAIKIANEDPAHDRNAAVKKAAEKMAEKRNGVLNRSMSH
jgi:hypothetical protein